MVFLMSVHNVYVNQISTLHMQLYICQLVLKKVCEKIIHFKKLKSCCRLESRQSKPCPEGGRRREQIGRRPTARDGGRRGGEGKAGVTSDLSPPINSPRFPGLFSMTLPGSLLRPFELVTVLCKTNESWMKQQKKKNVLGPLQDSYVLITA